MTITTIAGKKLKESFAKAENSNNFVRLFIAGFGWGGPKFGIALEGQKNKEDRISEIDGFSVIYEPQLKAFLEGVTIDYRKSFLSQGDFVVEIDDACC